MSGRQKVVIVGGGIAGLTAAHELSKRNFDVTVYERRLRCGGKAASTRVPSRVGRPDERPGEHGFRFFPAWYRHVLDTMGDIPFQSPGGRTVRDHLVACDQNIMLRYDGPPVPVVLRLPQTSNQVQALRLFLDRLREMNLPWLETLFFFRTLATFLSMPKPDRERAYDGISWWKFVDADKRSPAFRQLTVATTRSLLAARATDASAYTIATLAVRALFDSPLARDRVLDGPTSEVWIDPWVRYLKGRCGVKFELGCELESIVFKGREKEIESLIFSRSMDSVAFRGLRDTVRDANGRGQAAMKDLIQNKLALPAGPEARLGALTTHVPEPLPPISADYFVFALPVEQMAYYVNRTTMMTYHDDSLRNIVKLAGSVAWMAGIQFYLRAPLGFTRGHIVCADSEWALTAVEQTQFWPDVAMPDDVQAILSVDISDWGTPGRFLQKEAYRCEANEIADEVWRQLKASFNRRGSQDILSDSILVGGQLTRNTSYHLDDDIIDKYDRRKQAAYNRAQAARFSADEFLSEREPEDSAYAFGDRLQVNAEPLLINRPGSLALRPSPETGIRNMFLAADYVKTATNLACMESANEAARAAVNAILKESGASADPCETWGFEDTNIVAKAVALASGIETIPGASGTIALASGAAEMAGTTIDRAKQAWSQIWKRP